MAVCRDHLYSCSEAGQRDIAKDIQQFGLNRLVVAACSPKLHEPTFRRLLAENGVNPYLLEIVNIREHCSWVHAQEPEAALEKALELIRMGLAKVRAAVPLAERQVPLTRAALVIGGGPAGLRAALDIAHAGIPVTLVERAPVLGGMANRLYKTFPQGQSMRQPHQPHDGRGDASPRHHGAHRQRRHRGRRPPGQLPGDGHAKPGPGSPKPVTSVASAPRSAR